MPPQSNGPNKSSEHLEPTEELETDDDLSITYVANTETYHVTVEPDTETPLTITIVLAIAAITQSDPLEIDQRLADYIDPEGLERLYNPDRDSSRGQPVVSFSYAGHQITVESPSEITISP